MLDTNYYANSPQALTARPSQNNKTHVNIRHDETADGNHSFSVNVSSSISQISQGEWEAIFPSHPESYGFFKTVEETLSSQFKTYYISIYDNASIVCVAPCFVTEYPLETPTNDLFKKVATFIRKLLPGFFVIRVVVCGSPTSEGRIGIKKSPHNCTVIEMLVKEMWRIAGKERASFVVFKEFSQEYNDVFKPLLKMNFSRAPSFPSTQLDSRFKSFDEYFLSLSKNARKNLKKKFKEVDNNITINVEVKDDLGELLDDAYRLYMSTFSKGDVKFEVMTKDFFKAISKNMPGKAKFFLWSINGKLAAFQLCLISDGIFTAEYIGLDYDIAYTYHLYFITFRDRIKWCIENNITRYEDGAGNYVAKRRLGLTLVPQFIYVKHENSVINFLFKFIIMCIKPENFDPALRSINNE